MSDLSGKAQHFLGCKNYIMLSAATALKSDREIVPPTERTRVVENLSGYGNETCAYSCRFVAMLT